MNSKRIRFETLRDLARQEQPPTLDVVDGVTERISTGLPELVSDWTLWGASGVSVAAAAAVLFLAIEQNVLFSDPLASWLQPFVVVLQ